MKRSDLHETDRFAWLEEQTRLLKAGALSDLDVPSLIDELESEMGNERRELYRRLRVLLAHLLKWQFQPDARSNCWSATVRIQRSDIARLLKDAPSLRRFVAEEITEAYPDAVQWAADETVLPDEAFVAQCPYAPDQVLSRDFWPES